MLVKVKHKGEQRFVKIYEVKLVDLFDEAFKKFGIPLNRLSDAKLFDETKTKIDEDVFEEVMLSNIGHVYELSLDSTPEELDAEVMQTSRESSILDIDDCDAVILNIESPLQTQSSSRNKDSVSISFKDNVLVAKLQLFLP
ncbi:unnamed protein product [Knipowitschia caucasica]|uniref:Uncharacterized protein n=1 Tax=Knipowitschia caucasica TaxID=637954 RepID=A0AAV2IQY0_KNICA